MNDTATDTPPEVLRARMVDRLRTRMALAPTVVDAMLAVERHRYVPQAPLAEAYDESAVITHRFPDGTSLSCASDPHIVSAMLNALQVRPRQKIMEVGAGTGYNAALLSTLTGRDGHVTTIDINADVTANARRNLDSTGFNAVTVLIGDGARGAAQGGPYDRIIVTVGAWDLPRAWWDQLVVGGRLVVPLRWRGTTRAISFIKREDRWESDWMFLCGFVPMLGQTGERNTTIDPDGLVTLHYDIDQNVDVDALSGVLDGQRSARWSDVTVHGQESFDRVWLHLSVAEAGTVRIQADRAAVDAGLCTPAIPVRSPAIIDGGSLAYLAIRRSETEQGRWQLGAIGHGPAADTLAGRVVDQIHAWDRDRDADPDVAAYPAGMAVPEEAARIIDKPDIRLLLRY
ncbi:methyltransferase, FxLD system [Micromonospora sp. WMMD1102]|uniref:methyltransferase, FxLD system n=1 Tax=Micromonospora sp. WMMD1102 TaxID=3016105 RepID=UPI00241590DA|nr:methyltransferase, FxLD system [Micromonospora sp. WMMD1102]MDG4787153.1 methyltransferase, FxLD system [Micromonospora sp. WMMD1102]